jgi:hypothetical protein
MKQSKNSLEKSNCIINWELHLKTIPQAKLKTKIEVIKDMYTFKNKVKWLSKHFGHEVKETELHSPGQFIFEVERDFDKLFKNTDTEIS